MRRLPSGTGGGETAEEVEVEEEEEDDKKEMEEGYEQSRGCESGRRKNASGWRNCDAGRAPNRG
eukprot:787750-Pyramimonas_sp.AAC.1